MAPLLHSGIDRGFESLTVHEENLACDAASITFALVTEPADVADSKSAALKGVGVRLSPGA